MQFMPIKVAAKDIRYFTRSKFSRKSCNQQLFSVIFETNPNETLICLKFSEIVFHWSKFKARLRDILFSRTFDPSSAYSNRKFRLKFHVSLNQRNILHIL